MKVSKLESLWKVPVFKLENRDFWDCRWSFYDRFMQKFSRSYLSTLDNNVMDWWGFAGIKKREKTLQEIGGNYHQKLACLEIVTTMIMRQFWHLHKLYRKFCKSRLSLKGAYFGLWCQKCSR